MRSNSGGRGVEGGAVSVSVGVDPAVMTAKETVNPMFVNRIEQRLGEKRETSGAGGYKVLELDMSHHQLDVSYHRDDSIDVGVFIEDDAL